MAAKKGSGNGPSYNDLRANYKRLYRNMVEHNVPKDVAASKALALQQHQEAYNKSPRKSDGKHYSNDRNKFADWFFDEFYDELESEYGYDLYEDYPEEE